MSRRFVGEPVVPATAAFDVVAMVRGEPGLPPSFRWRDEDLTVVSLLRTWRGTKDDRGDTYLARHWFEFALPDGRRATVYFERHARRNQPRWWLYAIDCEEPTSTPER